MPSHTLRLSQFAEADVPFRSVASRIVKSLSDEAREFVQLDLLRPPTFEQLGKTLREAKTRGQPTTSFILTDMVCTQT